MCIVPANVQEYLDKAPGLESDVVCFDVQDSITKHDGAKREGREMAVAAIKKGGFKCREVNVRVNSPGSPWFLDDIKAFVGDAGVWSIRLTHAYGLDDVLYAEGAILAAANGRPVEITLSLDMPKALYEIEEIARRSKLITAIWLSAGDFALETGSANLGFHRTDSMDWLHYTRGRIVNVARANGWNCGDIVRAAPGGGPDALRVAMRESRMFGFDGTSVAAPRSIPIANEVYGVSAEELAWARNLVAKWEAQNDGPDWKRDFRVIDGTGVYAPTYEYAQRVIFFKDVIDGDPEKTQTFHEHGLASAAYLVERRAAPILSNNA
jgi:citrate lyase subunit beta/citryl-CoA lyase